MCEANAKYKKKSLTLVEKKRILEEIDTYLENNSMSATKLSKKLNIPRSTLITILKSKDSILANVKNDDIRFRAPNKKENPSKGIGKYDGLEKKLAKWISEQGGRKCVSYKSVRIKAKEISEEMGIDKFTASSGWIDRFKKRHMKDVNTCLCEHGTSPLTDNLPPILAQDYLNHIAFARNPKVDECENRPKWKQYREIERKLMVWQDLAERDNVTITGALLRDMSLSLAAALNAGYFSASVGWLNKYKKKRTTIKCSVCVKRKEHK